MAASPQRSAAAEGHSEILNNFVEAARANYNGQVDVMVLWPSCAQAAGGVHPERPQLVTVDLASSSTGIRVSSAHTFLMPGALIYYHDPSDPRSISRKSISKSGSRRHRVNLLWFRQLQFRQLPTGRIRSPVMNRGRGPE